MDVFHLLSALISQEDSIVPVVLQKLEADLEKIKIGWKKGKVVFE